VAAARSRAQAERTSVAELEMMIRSLQQAETDMRRATQPRPMLEMALIRLTEIRGLQSLQEILDRLVTLEGRLGGPPATEQPSPLPLFDRPSPPAPRPAPVPYAAAATRPAIRTVEPPPAPPDAPPAAPPADLASGWETAVSRLKGRKRLASVLAEVRAAGMETDRLLLEVPNGNAFVRETLEEAETRKLLGETASTIFGRRLRVEYQFIAAPPPAPPVAADGSADGLRVQDHPVVQEALSLFGGTILHDSAR
jgi:DNA polymerase III gamma/tau subunit